MRLKSHTHAVAKRINANLWMAGPWNCKCPLDILVIAQGNVCKRVGLQLAARSGHHPALVHRPVKMFCAIWASRCKGSNCGLGKKLNENPVSQIIS